MEIAVIRKPRLIDTMFTVSVVILVSLVSINFGCAVDWSKLKDILRKPIGPLAAFGGQFIFMPLVRFFVVHKILSRNNEENIFPKSVLKDLLIF